MPPCPYSTTLLTRRDCALTPANPRLPVKGRLQNLWRIRLQQWVPSRRGTLQLSMSCSLASRPSLFRGKAPTARCSLKSCMGLRYALLSRGTCPALGSLVRAPSSLPVALSADRSARKPQPVDGRGSAGAHPLALEVLTGRGPGRPRPSEALVHEACGPGGRRIDAAAGGRGVPILWLQVPPRTA